MSGTLTQAPTRASVSPFLVLATIVAAALSLACEPTNLPDDQLLESAHFRYHARADAVLDPTILDRLEAKRADIVAAFGVASDVVDYYLYRDQEDLAASVPCSVPCTRERRIFSQVPFQEHELVHALLHEAGSPALVMQEGVAQYAACAQPNLAYFIDPTAWPDAVGSFARYPFGQRLTSWMIEVGGPKRFIDFFGTSLATTDPALFALQFQRAWGRPLGEVAVTIDDARYAGSVCPCTAPALTTDGSASRFVGTQEYRVLDVPTESLLELDNGGPQIALPVSCTNGNAFGASEFPSAPSTRTFARVAAGKHAVTTLFRSEDILAPALASVTATLTPTSDWSCTSAPRVTVGENDVTLWVADAPPGETTWFAIDLPTARRLEPLSEVTLVRSCTACPCNGFGLGAVSPVISAGPAVIGLSSTIDPRRVAASAGVRLSVLP